MPQTTVKWQRFDPTSQPRECLLNWVRNSSPISSVQYNSRLFIVAPQMFHIEVGLLRNSAHLGCQELARNLPHSQMDDNEFEPGNRFSPLGRRGFHLFPTSSSTPTKTGTLLKL